MTEFDEVSNSLNRLEASGGFGSTGTLEIAGEILVKY